MRRSYLPTEMRLHDLRVDIGYLSADLLQLHETGTTGERLAAHYLVERFREIGMAPGLDRA